MPLELFSDCFQKTNFIFLLIKATVPSGTRGSGTEEGPNIFKLYYNAGNASSGILVKFPTNSQVTVDIKPELIYSLVRKFAITKLFLFFSVDRTHMFNLSINFNNTRAQSPTNKSKIFARDLQSDCGPWVK